MRNHNELSHLAQVSDTEWEQLRDADFSAASSLPALPLTERWIVSALHAVRHFSAAVQALNAA